MWNEETFCVCLCFVVVVFCVVVTCLAVILVSRIKDSQSEKLAAEETARKLGQIIAERDSKR